MSTKITDGWDTTDVSGNKLPPNLAASSQLLNLHFGILLSQARLEEAIVGTASACSCSCHPFQFTGPTILSIYRLT